MTTIHFYFRSDLAPTTNDEGSLSLEDLHRNFLKKRKLHFMETNLSQDPASLASLKEKHSNLPLPGFLVQDMVWVHSVDEVSLQCEFAKALFIVWQAEGNSTIHDEASNGYVSDGEEKSIRLPSPPLGKGQLEDSFTSQAISLYTTEEPETATRIKLPKGSQVEIGSLLRKLMELTEHRKVENGGEKIYYFRGSEVMEQWSTLFYGDSQTDVTEFASMLIERGVLHNYTPDCANLGEAFLCLQPFKEPHVLNSFIKWSSMVSPLEDEKESETSLDSLLRISRLMDEICKTGWQDDMEKFHRFQLKWCQIQILQLPAQPEHRVCFILNLFSIAVRYARITFSDAWPGDLEGINALFQKVGIELDGGFLSLAEMMAYLFSNDQLSQTPLVSETNESFLTRLFCRCQASTVKASSFYGEKVCLSDPRLVFAMTLGMKDSPNVSTVVPNKLHEALEQGVTSYVHRHVKMTDRGVVLPLYIGWFRNDIGNSNQAKECLHTLIPYLSNEQQSDLHALWAKDIVHVEFATRNTDWTPNVIVPVQEPTTEEKDPAPEASLVKEESTVDHSLLKFQSSRSLQWSLPPAKELLDPMDPASEFMDPTPLKAPALLKEQPSFRHKSGDFIPRFFARSPSVGDFSPHHSGGLDQTEETQYIEDDDGRSYGQTVLSEITFDYGW